MTQVAVRQFWKTPGNELCVDTVEKTALQWLLNGDPWLLNGIIRIVQSNERGS